MSFLEDLTSPPPFIPFTGVSFFLKDLTSPPPFIPFAGVSFFLEDLTSPPPFIPFTDGTLGFEFVPDSFFGGSINSISGI